MEKLVFGQIWLLQVHFALPNAPALRHLDQGAMGWVLRLDGCAVEGSDRIPMGYDSPTDEMRVPSQSLKKASLTPWKYETETQKGKQSSLPSIMAFRGQTRC